MPNMPIMPNMPNMPIMPNRLNMPPYRIYLKNVR